MAITTWKVVKPTPTAVEIWTEDDRRVAVVEREYNNQEKNAALIASAPELLAAVKAERAHLAITTRTSVREDERLKELDALIAKAEGRN